MIQYIILFSFLWEYRIALDYIRKIEATEVWRFVIIAPGNVFFIMEKENCRF